MLITTIFSSCMKCLCLLSKPVFRALHLCCLHVMLFLSSPTYNHVGSNQVKRFHCLYLVLNLFLSLLCMCSSLCGFHSQPKCCSWLCNSEEPNTDAAQADSEESSRKDVNSLRERIIKYACRQASWQEDTTGDRMQVVAKYQEPVWGQIGISFDNKGIGF